MALPMPMAPLMLAELTPFVTQSWSWVVGLNVSAASDCSPTGNAGSSVLMVKVAGAVNPAGTLLATSVRVMLATTVPCSCTAANAPVFPDLVGGDTIPGYAEQAHEQARPIVTKG